MRADVDDEDEIEPPLDAPEPVVPDEDKLAKEGTEPLGWCNARTGSELDGATSSLGCAPVEALPAPDDRITPARTSVAKTQPTAQAIAAAQIARFNGARRFVRLTFIIRLSPMADHRAADSGQACRQRPI